MYNANYMDGVPVKIAEKYKPPPFIYKLPQSLANKLNLDKNYYWNCPVNSYDFQLEQKALSKIEQWKRIRQRNKELRRERILRREEQRKKEDEDRQKNLLYSVSYPSTDDLSSDEEDEKVDVDLKYKKNSKDISQSKETSPQICVTETISSFHNILQPTVLSFNSSSNTNSAVTPVIKSTYESKLSNSFNYKDFEDDTSSPFDNIELKTINDLDVLAQVLHNTQIKYPADQKLIKNGAVVSNYNTNESPINCNSEREYTISLSEAENIPKHNNLPRFNYNLNSTQEAFTQLRDHYSISASEMLYNANLPPPSTRTHLYNKIANSYDYSNLESKHSNQSSNKMNSDNSQPYDRLQTLADDQVNKSKSVPNILKELRDEIRNSEIRRYRNCSYNKVDSTQNVGMYANIVLVL